MRISHPRRAFTWPTTRFSTFWRQRISTAAMATSASFVAMALRADQAAASLGPRSRKPHSRFLRHYYYYNPNHGHQHTQQRGRSQGRESSSGRTDEWRTCRNSGGRPLGRFQTGVSAPTAAGRGVVWVHMRAPVCLESSPMSRICWSNSSGSMSSHRRPQRHGVHISQGWGARS